VRACVANACWAWRGIASADAVELLAERGEPHRPGGAVEQGRADAVFLFLDRLADPGRGDMEPLSGPPEVQFFGPGRLV
jgi:hypothetical protein